MLAAWAYADIRRADSPSGMLRLSCLTRAGAGAARDPRCGARRRTGRALRRARRQYARPPRRRRHRRLVARRRGFDRRRGAVRRSARRRPPDAAGAEAFERRLGDVADSQVKTMFGGKVCDDAAGQRPSPSSSPRFAKPPASIRRYSQACCRRRFPMPSRCRAAGSICSTDCWRKPTMPTRSRACWRTSSAISSIATTCAG